MKWIKYGTDEEPIPEKPILVWGSIPPFGPTFHRGHMGKDHIYWAESHHANGTKVYSPIEYPEFWMEVEEPEAQE